MPLCCCRHRSLLRPPLSRRNTCRSALRLPVLLLHLAASPRVLCGVRHAAAEVLRRSHLPQPSLCADSVRRSSSRRANAARPPPRCHLLSRARRALAAQTVALLPGAGQKEDSSHDRRTRHCAASRRLDADPPQSPSCCCHRLLLKLGTPRQAAGKRTCAELCPPESLHHPTWLLKVLLSRYAICQLGTSISNAYWGGGTLSPDLPRPSVCSVWQTACVRLRTPAKAAAPAMGSGCASVLKTYSVSGSSAGSSENNSHRYLRSHSV